MKRPSRRNPARLKHQQHSRLWAIVEGAVLDAFKAHPDYLTDHGQNKAVQSVTKRVVGQLAGFVSNERAKETLGMELNEFTTGEEQHMMDSQPKNIS